MADSKVNVYKAARNALGWSREAAAEELGISDDKLERIENGKQLPNPQDVKIMSDVYRSPELCNHYCHFDCEIGAQYVPEIPDKELAAIVLKIIDSIYEADDIKRTLVNITADGVISDDEIPALVQTQSRLEKLSNATEALQLCIERKIDNGDINKELYVKEFKKAAGK